MAKKFRVTARGATVVLDAATFFDRYRPGEDTARFTIGADAVESIEVVDVATAFAAEEVAAEGAGTEVTASPSTPDKAAAAE